MDDRDFDSLAKSLATARTRRQLLKGLLGIGGIAAIGSVAHNQNQTDAARRPNNTPTPVAKCPGKQTWDGAKCICPGAARNMCGPDCCIGKSTDSYPRASTHSECCDNACCFGTCSGEAFCCPTNNRSVSGQTLPPLASVCANGECCLLPKVCSNGVCVGSTPTNPAPGTTTSTPTNTPTRMSTNTPTNTPTNTAVPSTNTPTNTPVPPTSTPTNSPTNTPVDSCIPATCTQLGCGDHPDGCGTTLHCGCCINAECGADTECTTNHCSHQGFCTQQTASPVNCLYGDWSDWSACSATCGTGTVTRSRVVLVQGSCGGVTCDDSTLVEQAPCTMQPCDCGPIPTCQPGSCGPLFDTCGHQAGFCIDRSVTCAPGACGPLRDACGTQISMCTDGCACEPIPIEDACDGHCGTMVSNGCTGNWTCPDC